MVQRVLLEVVRRLRLPMAHVHMLLDIVRNVQLGWFRISKQSTEACPSALVAPSGVVLKAPNELLFCNSYL